MKNREELETLHVAGGGNRTTYAALVARVFDEYNQQNVVI